MKSLILTFRRIFFVTIFIFLMTTISLTIDANDEIEDENSQNNSYLTDDSILPISENDVKPKIEFNFVGITPKTPMVGQDFTVEYELIPHPFQHNISKPKEIVLVLDKSGSMKDNNKMNNLKTAATNFIDQLTSVKEGTKTPVISNLKISIVVYDKNGIIKQDLVQVTDTETVKKANVDKLKKTINDLKADGGTNTGDGLRKAAYVLDKGDSTANKTLILMSDGLPTYYTYKITDWWWQEEFYTELNDKNGSIGGSGSSDKNGNCLNYAKTIGEIIKSKNYNVYSIGYGLGNDQSEANKKLKQIHESMGGVSSGENNTFFATDSGAIDSVFSSIADQLQKSYAFNDAQFNFNLNDSFTFESQSNNGIFKFDPIVYNLGEGNWYRAEKQVIRFTLKSSQAGDLTLFNENPTVSYTDIYGVSQTISIPNRTISVAPYSTDKLQVDLGSNSNGYLIGDTIEARVTATHPGSSLERFSELTYNLIEIPDNFEVEKDNLNFGTISESTTQNINININNDEQVTEDDEKFYLLKGSYQYNVTKYQVTTSQSGENILEIPVRRGQIKVKVVDESNQDITRLAKVSLKNYTTDSRYQDGYLIFDTVPSGNYELVLESLPEGLEINEENKNSFVRVSYNQNIAEYTFQAKGVYEEESYPNIDVHLTSVSPESVSNGDEVTVTYQINPQSFNLNLEDTEGISKSISEAIFVLDTSKNITQNAHNNAYVDALNNNIMTHRDIKKREFKLSVIGYNDKLVYPDEKLIKLYSVNEQNEDLQNLVKNIPRNNKTDRDIAESLKKANTLLSNSNNVGKAIVIIGTDNIKIDQNTIDLIKGKGYKIISFLLPTYETSSSGSYSLKKLHQELGGKDSDYFETPYEGGNYNFANRDMAKVREALLTDDVATLPDSYSVSPTLNFDLGEHFSPVSGLNAIKDSLYELEIPQIIYRRTTTYTEDGKYKFEADPFEVSFKVKVNTEEIGNITFNNIDYVEVTNITYTDFKGKIVKNLIETPVVEVMESDPNLNHGLYGGVNNSNNSFEVIPSEITENGEDLRKEFLGGSIVNFAGTFTYKSSLQSVQLLVDKEFNISENNVKAYKILTTNSGVKLEEIQNVEVYSARQQSNDLIMFNFVNKIPINTPVLIHYSVKVPDINNGIYTNTLRVGTKEKSTSIKSIKQINEDKTENLPYLF